MFLIYLFLTFFWIDSNIKVSSTCIPITNLNTHVLLFLFITRKKPSPSTKPQNHSINSLSFNLFVKEFDLFLVENFILKIIEDFNLPCPKNKLNPYLNINILLSVFFNFNKKTTISFW